MSHIERAKLLLLLAEEAQRAAAAENHVAAVACHRKRLAMCCSDSTLSSEDECLRFDIMDDSLRSHCRYLQDLTADQFIQDLPLFGGASVKEESALASAIYEEMSHSSLSHRDLILEACRSLLVPRTEEVQKLKHPRDERCADRDCPPKRPQPAVIPIARSMNSMPPGAAAAPAPISAPVGPFAEPKISGQVLVSHAAGLETTSTGGFVTAAQQLQADIKAGRAAPPPARRLGLNRRQPFQVPFRSNGDGGTDAAASIPAPPTARCADTVAKAVHASKVNPNPKLNEEGDDAAFPQCLLNPDGSIPTRLENLDPRLLGQIASEILEYQVTVTWDDIAGLEHAKAEVDEAIVWPLARPDLFRGLRDPPRGLLLFGPPGTGKTMIARAIASRGNCTFMSVSASSLMSKWVGDGEKLVRCLFAVAGFKQPTVVFIDEIDSLLSMRSEGEMDAIRRVKTEFLVQLDGVGTNSNDRVLIIGATNRPEELDEAARRRMEKRLYIPLPDHAARKALLKRLLLSEGFSHDLCEEDFETIASRTAGFSGADVRLLARDAALGPLREQGRAISSVAADDIRPVQKKDFALALRRIKPSVGPTEIARYEEFNANFGSFDANRELDRSLTASDDFT